MHPYNISYNIDDCKCQHRCENDTRCNGYSIDDNTGTCSLSRCNYTKRFIRWSSDSIFNSRKIPTSLLSCVSVTTRSADTTLKYTTPLKKQTTLEQTISVTSHIPMDEATNVTKLNTLALSLNSGSINDVTQKIVNNALCVCVCKDVNQTLEKSIEKRKRELILNKTKLSAYLRKRTSIPDNRKTSRVVGIVAVIIVVMYGLLFFGSDIWTLLAMCHSKMTYKNNSMQPGI